MKMLRIVSVASLLVSIPAVALAGVTFKNKEKKQVEITIKRAGSSQNTAVGGGMTMEIPGSPMTVTVNGPAKSKAAPQKIDAVEGDTLVYEKGKLTREANENADPDDAPKSDAAPSDAK